MRCPKCGRISFDYLSSCDNCGADLTEIREMLGNIPSSPPDFSWFKGLVDDVEEDIYYQEDKQEVEFSSDFPNIDVSDLIEEDEDAPIIEQIPIPELNEEEISMIGSNDELQSALDKVLSGHQNSSH